jgi:hypothetical protein
MARAVESMDKGGRDAELVQFELIYGNCEDSRDISRESAFR